MTINKYSTKAHDYILRLCGEIPNRRVGSSGNRAATDFFAETVALYGFQTGLPQFDCIDWEQGLIHLKAGDEPFQAFIGPYSLGCNVTAPMVVASTVDELESIETSGNILMLLGEIAKEQLMPKNFVFYNPDRHKHIIKLLEEKAPLAIISATSRDPQLAGGVYPFPLIEDGDFDIPNAYMKDVEGERLEAYAGSEVSLLMEAERSPSKGCNVIARIGGDAQRRIVLFAHIDTKDNTPGALDNATGVVILMLLAELLQNYSGSTMVEIVALNGEDYYSAPGEMQYVRDNRDKFDEIVLGINLDGAGYIGGNTAYSLYGVPDEIAGLIHQVFSSQPGMVEGELWYQSDHSIFLMHQRPALAVTTEEFEYLSTYISHNPLDAPDKVDSNKLVHIAFALRDLILSLDRMLN